MGAYSRPVLSCFDGDSEGGGLLADVGDEGHEAGPFDGIAGGSLEGCAVAAAFAGEHLALVGAELLQEADVFVVDVSRARATFGGAEPATILTVTSKFLPRHRPVPGVLERIGVLRAYGGETSGGPDRLMDKP